MANILITGGAGFIGSHTADALIARGHEVRILDILDPQIHGTSGAFPAYMNPAVECIQGDVRDVGQVAEALRDVDAIYHFAALTGVGQSMYDLSAYVDTNCTGTAALLEAILKRGKPIKRLVLASSRAVYGEGTHSCPEHGTVYPGMRSREAMERGEFSATCPVCGMVASPVATAEERPLEPISVYGWTKKQQEEQCQYVAKTFAMPVTMLRYFNVYGSRQSLKNPYTGVVSIFYSRILAGQPIYVYEHGTPGRDFVHIADVVQANLAALEQDTVPGTCVNVGSGQRHSILDVANTLAKVIGKQAKLEDRGEFRVGDIHFCYADQTRARQLLGIEAQISLETGLQEFVAWARSQQSVDLYQQTVEELQRHGLFGKVAGTP